MRGDDACPQLDWSATVTLAQRFAPRPGVSFAIVLCATFLAFCALYIPQPLLPTLSTEFAIPPTSSAWMISQPLLCLALAPLFVGPLLNRASAQRVLLLSVAALGLLLIGCLSVNSFATLMLLRSAQGLMFPLIFTSAVTYCSRAGERSAVAARVATYIATTIVGGLAGRLLGGFLGEAIGWRETLAVTGAGLVLVAVPIALVVRDSSLPRPRSDRKSTFTVLRDPVNRAGLVLIATVFFAFSASLNALPFRLVEIEPTVSPSLISLTYLGYVVGVVIALNLNRIIRHLGGEIRTLTLALAVFLTGLVLLRVPHVGWLVMTGFVTCAGMFTMHATLTGFLNSRAGSDTSVVNGLYIAIYYMAGSLGSLLPLWIYRHSSWSVFLVSIVLVSACGAFALARLAHRSSSASWRNT